MFLRKGLTGVMDYVSENHSKYLLMVHLIFVVVNDNITMNRKWKIKMYKNDH